MQKRYLNPLLALLIAGAALLIATPLSAADEAADAMVRRLSSDVLEVVRGDKSVQAGDVSRIVALVDERIMPNVNFQRMTASAVGPMWRQATPDQQKRLQDEFKTLLVRTYAGALAQVGDQTIVVKPLRAAPTDTKELEQWCRDSIAANAKAVAEFKAGKDTAINALKGPIMKAAKGKANPKLVDETLRRLLTAM